MRIGEVAAEAGVSVETLRYYERRGLLPEPRRTPGGHREYGRDAVRFVRAVKEAQTLGFSLAEIEAHVELARRRPDATPRAVRERLEEKLAEVDGKVAALQTMRAALERALYEVWDAVDRSTSNAAYLARRGREPKLGTAPLHVTDGESVASTLRTTSIDGVVLSWDDVLHIGPLAFEPAESRPLRARFLAEHGWGDESAILADLARRDELLASARSVALWFEHDLFDQLQLLQVLSQVSQDAAVELVQADGYLGPLAADELEALWPTRTRVDAATRADAREAWRAVCAGEPAEGVPALPHLASALRRLEEERAPLSRTKRQLLEALADGPMTAVELFAANQAREEAVFLGDTWCFLFLWELAQDGALHPVGGGPMPLPPPRGDHARFAGTMLELG